MADKTWRFGPFRRDRHEANAASRRFLEAIELVRVRRPHLFGGMCSSRTIFGRDVWTFDMESLEDAGFRQSGVAPALFCIGKIPQCRGYAFMRTCDYCRKTS